MDEKKKERRRKVKERQDLLAGQRGGEEVDAVGAPAAAGFFGVDGRSHGGVHGMRCGWDGFSSAYLSANRFGAEVPNLSAK
uniref:Uncharacterized protein n=1 Tax=Oryza sativa subsp. japonica TaxID=39947 RepID=Q6K978_ORYSJ|nr:hypothetical protein [Oryza sativa Japonica Group]